MSTGYHTYGVDWQADYITYYFDGNQVWKTATPADMNEPMYMIANLAVGGYWPGMVNSTTPFPAEMKIDYIRAYSDKGVAPPPPPPPTTTPPTTTPPTTTPPTTTHPATPPAVSGGLFSLPMTGSGIDTITTTAASYTLASGAENLILGGSGPQTGIGNSLNNILMSNNHGSKLDGGAGNDILVAGRSWDVLTGGSGTDIFQFNNLPWNNSRITDFTVGTDKLDLRGLFSAANYHGTNPVADGYLSFVSDGAGGTKVCSIRTVPGLPIPGSSWSRRSTGVAPSSLHMQPDWFFSGTAGSNPPPTTTPPTTTADRRHHDTTAGGVSAGCSLCR